jgi:hypothetical protein
MKTRQPTRPILRTYVKNTVGKQGSTKYKSLIVNNKTKETFSCSRTSLDDSVRCVKRKVGIK